MSDQDKIQRSILPIPDRPFSGAIMYDAKDPDTKFPPIKELRPPKGVVNRTVAPRRQGQTLNLSIPLTVEASSVYF